MSQNDDQIKRLLSHLEAVECFIDYLQQREDELDAEFSDLAKRALFNQEAAVPAYQRFGALKFVSGLKARLLHLRKTGQ